MFAFISLSAVKNDSFQIFQVIIIQDIYVNNVIMRYEGEITYV